MKRIARLGSALAALVVGTTLLGACNDDSPKTTAKTPNAAAMDCTDPNIPMGEWRKRCDTGSGGASASAKDSAAPRSSAPAPETTAIPGAGSTTAKVGDTISLTGFEGVKLDATVVKVVDPAAPENEYMKPKAGTRLVAVQWRIANTGTVPVDSGPTSGSNVVDGSGQQFDTSYHPTSAGPEFPSGVKIPPGESRLGFVTYEVPDDSKVVKIQFAANSGYAKQTGQWAVS